jgi:DEAD/DEAH box helicase domain-containing protein
VYLHQGDTYLVQDLDLDEGAALVRPAEPPYSTWARDTTDITAYDDAGCLLARESWSHNTDVAHEEGDCGEAASSD